MGIFLAFLVAIINGGKDVLMKKRAERFHPLLIAWSWQFFGLAVTIPVLIFVGIPNLNTTFWVSSSLKILVNLAAIILYAYALKKTDVSLATPMLAFSPILVAIISFFINGESPSLIGWMGITVTIVGLYLLHFDKQKKKIFDPFRAIFRDKGVLFMFLVAILWGVAASLDKTAVINSSPYFYPAYTAVITSILLGIFIISKRKSELQIAPKKEMFKLLAPIGFIAGVSVLMQMVAISLTVTAYVIAIKRTSIIFGSILASLLLGEKINQRIPPILIIIAGLLLVVLS